MKIPTILLVDDDPEDRLIMIDAFEQLNSSFGIGSAENGEVAIALLNEYATGKELPCLIVLDLNMPRMNGTETLKHIKSDDRLKDITVVIYSTSVNPLEQEICMQLGAQSYITKPLSYSESISTAKFFLTLCEKETLV